jgi:hypothetical protein
MNATAELPVFDRTTEDVGNIVLLEHVNVTQNDQRLTTLFWIGALGGTRDPYLHVLDNNMWINFGRQQIHSPTRAPQVLRGVIGMVTPDLDALRARLEDIAPRLANTRFEWRDAGDHVEATCPWGNRVRVHAPHAQFGRMRLGIPYVELPVPLGTADGIARFYRELLLTRATTAEDGSGATTAVQVGVDQALVYRESDAPLADYDGHHIAIYVANFAGPHDALEARGLVFEESDPWQYRFRDIVDPASGAPLFVLEHEVRSLTHPMYGRPLVNRNPAQAQRQYSPGHDQFY